MGASRAAARGCALLVVTVLATLLVGAPAHAAPVALAGTVVGTSGGLSGIEVTVYTRGGDAVQQTMTDSAGAWTTQVEPGTYGVGYVDPEGWWKPEFWDDKTSLATSTSLTVTTSGRGGVDATLARYPVVSGTVRSASTSGTEPVAGAEVRAYASAAETDTVRTVTAAADGTWSMPLPAGTYRLGFESVDHVIEYWNDKGTIAASDPVVVGTTDVRGRDVELTPLPVVSGRVTSGGTAVRRPEVTVYARDAATGLWSEQDTVVGDAQGRWSRHLGAGTYTFRFAGGPALRPEYWADRANLSTATSVALTSAPMTLDADLAALPTARGVVRDASGEPVEDATVVTLDAEGDEVATDRTGPDGAFGVPVVPGAYGLEVRARGFRPWARGVVDDPVVVGTRGADVGAIDLVPALAVRGRVTGPDGAGVRTDVVLWVPKVVSGQTRWTETERVRTGADGRYVAAVGPGDYRVEVEGTEDLLGEYWDDAATLASARTVTVGGADVTGRDAVLAPRARPGVRGTVTSTSGAPLEDARVTAQVLRDEAWDVVEETSTARDGSYRLDLPAGTYRIGFEADQHRTTYGPGSTTVADSTPVTVGTSAVVRDARLVPVSARVQGTVRGPSGAGVAGVEVRVMQGGTDDLVPVTSTRTDAAGRYEVRVDAGRYVLAFEDPAGDLRGEYFDDVSTWAAAARVVVEDGATLVGRDATLAAHPRLAGRVVTASGAGVGGAVVRLLRPIDVSGGGGDVVADATTDATGAYTLAAPAGTYAAEVLLDDQPRWTASSLALTSGTTTRTVTLTDQRAVSGRLVGPDGRAAGDVEVRAWRYDPRDDTAEVVARAVSGSDGRYVLPVPPGVYRLGFHGLARGYATTFSGAAADLAAASVVRVAGSDVTGADATLRAATGVSGTITDPAALDGTSPELEAVFLRFDATAGRWVEQERTTPSYGAYAVELPVGRYRVRVLERQEPFRTTHHGGGATFSSAADVEVTAGAVTPGVDVVVGSELGTLRATTAPTVSGTPVVGGVLTADPGTWGPAATGVGHQWLRDGTPIAGATDRTYAPGPADLGRRIAVRVVATRAGYRSGVATSTERTVDAGTLRVTSAPDLDRDPVLGTRVAGTRGVWSVPDVDLGWQWLRDGSPIEAATEQTYTPTTDDLGHALAVRVTAAAPGYAPLSLTSGARTVTDPPLVLLAPARTTGDAVVGGTLTAVEPAWSRTPVAVDRQWLRDGRPVDGETAGTYRLTAADVGAQVALRVTARVAGQDPVVTTSPPSTVAAGTLTATSAPVVTGTARPGATLSASAGAWSATDPTSGATTFGYRWLRDGRAITGATAATYRPTTADLGRAVTVEVRAARPGHATATGRSAARTVKARPTVSVSASGGRRTATFTVVVEASGTAPTGTVRVRLGSRTLRSATLTSYRGTRRAVVKVTGLSRGTRTYTVDYRGSTKVEARSVTTRVRVR
jgi:5-hydroxyisourate hydrolase-like protein (transthyretin family)